MKHKVTFDVIKYIIDYIKKKHSEIHVDGDGDCSIYYDDKILYFLFSEYEDKEKIVAHMYAD